MGPALISEHPTLFPALIAVLAASLAGSLHCVAMCGPIALLARGTSRWHPLFYHLGRLAGYLGLGALAGAFGAGVLTGDASGRIQTVLAALLGLLLVWTGLLWIRGRTSGPFAGKGLAGRLLERGFRRSLALPAAARNTMIGGLSVLLPCGWLYGFVLASAAAASAAAGAAVLLVFWLGTLPVFAVGTALTRVRALQRLDRAWVRRAVGALMIVLGVNSVHTHLSARQAASVVAAASASGVPTETAPAHHHCH